MGGDLLEYVWIQQNHPVSIHTPVWGVTVAKIITEDVLKGFNPHPRMGGDLKLKALGKKVFIVSIHTPVWGVTLFLLSIIIIYNLFQSTPPYGG